ncbi:hypothetical protein BJ741DRAFT_600440 [Chytriomyces cf. hyalinus JEL632]|nr:hypothetical protein BJ741DRAFT_600440 [Chytriomyces cf. hyalinus JEL632]
MDADATDTDSEPERAPRKRKGRPPSSTHRKPTHVQVVGEGYIAAVETLPPSVSVSLGLSASLAQALPTMPVVIQNQRRFYTRDQKRRIANYARIVGRNKAADELGLNRPMVGRWIRDKALLPATELSHVDVEAVSAGVHNVIPKTVILPESLSKALAPTAPKRKKKKSKKRVESSKPIAVGTLDPIGAGDEDADELDVDLEAEEEDASNDGSDDEGMSVFQSLLGDPAESFESAFAAIREAARVAANGS